MSKDVRDMLEELDADIDSLYERFAGNTKMILVFMKKFEKDKTFNLIAESIRDNNIELLYVYTHDLKGLSANLGMKDLSALCNDLLIDLKSKNYGEIKKHFKIIKREYVRVIRIIHRYTE